MLPAYDIYYHPPQCATYAAFLEERERPLAGREQGKALAEIEAEIDNVRAVA